MPPSIQFVPVRVRAAERRKSVESESSSMSSPLRFPAEVLTTRASTVPLLSRSISTSRVVKARWGVIHLPEVATPKTIRAEAMSPPGLSVAAP